MTVTPAELAATLIKRQRELREAEESRAEQLKALVIEQIEEARRRGLIQRAWLIGSLAWGTHGAGSDVDVVVEGLDPERAGQLWATLVDRLDCEVDLLRIEELSEDFARRVRTEGLPLS